MNLAAILTDSILNMSLHLKLGTPEGNLLVAITFCHSVATAVKLCARCTTLKAARASATNFARATLRKLSTGFLFKLFNAQFLDFASLRVLFLVVGSFFNVYSVM